MSLERRRRLVEIARERELLVLEDNPYGMLRYEGEPLPTLYSLDGGEFVIYLGTFSKILSPGLRLGWAAAPAAGARQAQPRQGRADLCSSSLSQLFVPRTSPSATGATTSARSRGLPPPARRDARRARRALPARGGVDPPEGGLFIWATLPDYIDTTDLLARALEENVAFVPGRAAYLDGRGGSSMRLNFSGVERGRDPRGRPADRQGRRASRSSSTAR